MYQIIYYIRKTKGLTSVKQEYKRYKGPGEFRLRKNALHYIRELKKDDYINNGYGVEQIVGGISCYKMEKDIDGEFQIIEIEIKAEKA